MMTALRFIPHVGEIGFPITITARDEDFSVKSIADWNTKNMALKSPSGTVAIYAATFVTDGSDGQLRFTTVDGTELSEKGWWVAQGQGLTAGGATRRTQAVRFQVGETLTA